MVLPPDNCDRAPRPLPCRHPLSQAQRGAVDAARSELLAAVESAKAELSGALEEQQAEAEAARAQVAAAVEGAKAEMQVGARVITGVRACGWGNTGGMWHSTA